MTLQLPDLDVHERLGRTVFSGRRARRARTKGIIDMDVFLEREEAGSISVDRMDHAPSSELAELSRERGQGRIPPRSFCGWAVLTVEDARRNGRTVEPTPRPENRFHADVFLNITQEERRRFQIQHANELAAHSKWLEAP